MSKYGVFSGPYFPVFELNTEIDGVTQSEGRIFHLSHIHIIKAYYIIVLLFWQS